MQELSWYLWNREKLPLKCLSQLINLMVAWVVLEASAAMVWPSYQLLHWKVSKKLKNIFLKRLNHAKSNNLAQIQRFLSTNLSCLTLHIYYGGINMKSISLCEEKFNWPLKDSVLRIRMGKNLTSIWLAVILLLKKWLALRTQRLYFK